MIHFLINKIFCVGKVVLLIFDFQTSDFYNPIYVLFEKAESGCGPSSLQIALRALDKKMDDWVIPLVVEDIAAGLSWDEMQMVAHIYCCEAVLNKNSSYQHLVDAHNETGCPIIVGWDSDRDGEAGAHFSVVKE